MVKMTKARQNAYEAVAELLKTRNIHKITVNEILIKAGISRSQFYRFFRDKYDLLNQTVSYQVDMVFSDESSPDVIKDNLITLLNMTREAYLTTTLYRNEHSELFQLYFDMILRLMRRRVCTIQKGQISPVQTRALRFAAAGATMMILDWLCGGCREKPEQIAGELIGLLPAFVLSE